MKIDFNLEYRTAYGERLAVNLTEADGDVSVHLMDSDDGATGT